MKKRLGTIVMAVTLLAALMAQPAAALGTLNGFTCTRTYSTGQFSDVAPSDWFAPYVQASYEYALLDGTPDGAFEPDGMLTVAEAIKLATCLHSIYYTGSADFVNGQPWYSTYVTYALESGILDEAYPNYNAPITRSDFAEILGAALPPEALSARNTVEDNAIPDVPADFSYAPVVYRLYRAGVLTGMTDDGHFYPNETLRRCEAAAVVTRMADASFRKSLTLTSALSAEEIYVQCAPSVFTVTVYDRLGTQVKSGSGFFISDTGLAVTNYHVIAGASSAVITAADGTQYDIAGVYDVDKHNDLALIQIDGTGFEYLSLRDSDSIATGESVFAIGSPRGYQNTISEGIISGLNRVIDGVTYIQTTASISPGSSGGVLLDAAGKVVGVTTATLLDAQNLNFVIPINRLSGLMAIELTTLDEYLDQTVFYQNLYPIPDFGGFAGVNVAGYTTDEYGARVYKYRLSDIEQNMTVESALAGYSALLTENMFTELGYAIENGDIFYYYRHNVYDMLVAYGVTNSGGVDYVQVMVYAD